jgi:hypothetical protein
MCTIVTLTLPNGEVKTDHIDCDSPSCPTSSANTDE